MLNKPTLKCERCGGEFKVFPYRRESARFCSRGCVKNERQLICHECGRDFTRSSYLIKDGDVFCSHACQCKHNFYDGHPQYANNTGENSYAWRGADVGYAGLHQWVRRNKEAPKCCQQCGATDSPRYEWANIDGQYKRNLEDWAYLCRSCHIAYDKENNLWGRRSKF